MLVSAIQQLESVIYIYTHIYLPLLLDIDFANHVVSVMITQLCCTTMCIKVVIDST